MLVRFCAEALREKFWIMLTNENMAKASNVGIESRIATQETVGKSITLHMSNVVESIQLESFIVEDLSRGGKK